jgi:nicotinamide-nucleotide amidase
MIAELICVGTELLMGQIVNTNAQYISEHLAQLGVIMYHQVVVGDNFERLSEAFQTAWSRSDVVILSGGLGPTDDDLTKETVAASLHIPLELNTSEWQKIVDYFAKMHRTAQLNNQKQAMFPKDGIILANPYGTAPGCIFEQSDKAAILLPGPPRELKPMFRDHVIPYLLQKSGIILYSRELRIFGIGESDIAYRLDHLIKNQTNPTIATYAKTGEVTIRITAKCLTETEGVSIVTPMIDNIKAILGDYVYSDNGETLPMVCHNLLLKHNKTLSVSESCTGGLLSSAFVDLPGSSAYFIEGAVTYANEAKNRRLGVSYQILNTVGPVSEECARDMAEGLRNSAHTDYSLSTTGIAGPDGGTKESPVGTVYVGLSSLQHTVVKKLSLNGDRTKIREVSVLHALDMLRRELLLLD